MSVYGLSMRQPWLYAVTHLGKRIENRTWSTRHRGRFLLHASKVCPPAYYDWAVRWMLERGVIKSAAQVPPADELQRGGMVGSVSLLDVFHRLDVPGRWEREKFGERADLRWLMEEQYNFLLDDPILFPKLIEYSATQRFFRVPDAWLQRVGMQDPDLRLPF